MEFIMSKKKIYGVIAPSIVPFTKDRAIGERKLKEYIKLLVDKAVHALFPIGSFGAGPLMNVEEQKGKYGFC